VTEFVVVFSGYELRQVSVLNRRFEDPDDDDDDDDRDDLRNVGSVRTRDAADSPRRFHQIQYVLLQKIVEVCTRILHT
jgi:hypothetical protein